MIVDIHKAYFKLIIVEKIQFWKYDKNLTFKDEILFSESNDIQVESIPTYNIIKKYFEKKGDSSSKILHPNYWEDNFASKNVRTKWCGELNKYANEILKEKWPEFNDSKLMEFDN